jgi:beta-fructofuranosidase
MTATPKPSASLLPPQIDARHWQRTPVLPLGVTGAAYEPRSLKGDASIHAWRDPFLFRREDSSYMLLAAKAVGLPLGRNGAVALLQAPGQQLSQWQPQLPLVSPGDYSEMEVPQLYQRRDGRLELLFSSTAALDFNPDQPHRGGLYGIGGQRLEDLAWQPPRNYLPAASGLYACRAIPELEGELVGFDLATGGIRRSGVKTYLDSLDRNFSNCTLGERA